MPKDARNILFITSDQQHWNTLGVLNPEIKTPNLDRLAGEGRLYSRAYCPNPTCTPTRASLITGKYPSQHGAYSLGTKLLEEHQTLGAILSENGYRTALIGKAHFQPLKGTADYPSLEAYPKLQDLDFWRRFNGPFYGFDHVELARNHTDESHVGQHYAIWMEDKGLSNWRDYFSEPTGNRPAQKYVWDIPEKYHYNSWIAERSEAALENYANSGDSFFLWSSFFDPHPSYLVPEPWASMYDPAGLTVPDISPGEHEKNPPHFAMTQQESPDFSAYREADGNAMHGFRSHLKDRDARARDMAVYYGMVSMLDHYVGRILNKLEALGLADSTMVVFTSDHGHLFGQHGLVAKGPFHYEDLVRVPFLVRMPGDTGSASEARAAADPGAHVEAIQSLVDFAPTVLDFAGIKPPGSMTGVSQLRVWRGEQKEARDHAIVENRHQPTTIHVKTYVNRRYKLTVYYRHFYGELFDLEEDPGETNNLWESEDHKELKTELLLRLVHAEQGKEPLPMPRIAPA